MALSGGIVFLKPTQVQQATDVPGTQPVLNRRARDRAQMPKFADVVHDFIGRMLYQHGSRQQAKSER